MAKELQSITRKEEEALTGINLEYAKKMSFKNQIKMLKDPKYIKFMLIPGASDDTLDDWDFQLNKYKSKRSIIRRLKAPLTILGFLIILVITSWAVFPHWISPYSFRQITSIDMTRSAYQPPSPDHVLGTTLFGQDVFGRLIWGARASLTLGLSTISISVVFGVILGIISAYKGGWIDQLIMRISDIIFAFPGLIIVILVISIFGTKVQNIMLVWGILGIPGYARLMRGAAIQERAKIYVEAAKVSGASELRIMFRHILPNSIAPIIIAVTFDMGGIILGLAGLSFLGFGAQGVEWGNDIAQNKTKLLNAPWAALWPGFGIV
ncbi:MAG: ABC transporter permease, partial [Promethearchaeota archaeon]